MAVVPAEPGERSEPDIQASAPSDGDGWIPDLRQRSAPASQSPTPPHRPVDWRSGVPGAAGGTVEGHRLTTRGKDPSANVLSRGLPEIGSGPAYGTRYGVPHRHPSCRRDLLGRYVALIG
jgi:hypothetical protein